jgi:hypothetical protein
MDSIKFNIKKILKTKSKNIAKKSTPNNTSQSVKSEETQYVWDKIPFMLTQFALSEIADTSSKLSQKSTKFKQPKNQNSKSTKIRNNN